MSSCSGAFSHTVGSCVGGGSCLSRQDGEGNISASVRSIAVYESKLSRWKVGAKFVKSCLFVICGSPRGMGMCSEEVVQQRFYTHICVNAF